MVEKALERHQFDVGAPNDSFLAEASAVPDANVQVSTGTFVQEDGVTLDTIPAAAVGPFAVFSGGGGDVERWDLVTLDPSGPTFGIVTTPGMDQPAGTFDTSVPVIPTDHIPIAAIKINEAGTVIVVQSDIEDVRSFYHSTHGDLGQAASTVNRRHKTEQSAHTQAATADWTVADGSSVKDHLDELATRGVFVAKIGGISPDYAGSAIRTALSDFENSGQESALFIVRADATFTGGNLTVTKPFKMVGQVEPGVSFYSFQFSGTSLLTLDTEATLNPGFVEAEFVGIDIVREGSATGGILFPKNSSLRARFSHIRDLATGPTVDFIRFTGDGTIELENSILTPIANQNLIGGTLLTVTCRRCDIDDTTGKAFGSTTLDLYLLEGTLFETDDFTDVTTLRVWLDGTSILSGKTQIPTGFTNLEVIGHDFWTPRFSTLGISFSDALNFNISGHVELASAVISLGASELIISRSNLVVSGTKSGSSGTRIEGSPSATGNKLVELVGNNIRLEGIVFRCSPSVSGHAASIIQFDVGTETGHEVIDCEFQAEGANDTGVAVSLGGTNGSGSVIKGCLVRSSPEGTAAFFRGGNALVVQGEGRIESCTVKNFLDTGIKSIGKFQGGLRVSNCLADMSSCTDAAAVGIQVSGTTLSNCQVHCLNLITTLDTAQAIQQSTTGGLGSESVIDNCQISGLGTSSTRRIGIGIRLPPVSARCKISGCTIRDFRKQGIKIEGDLNVVVHNIITSIDDGASTENAAIETIIGADNNVIDANLSQGIRGAIPYPNAGAANWFGATDQTGNKDVA
ncbi:hypothetical protein LCGC14_0332140 [marine sediment metagenome]|uniref:Right handed beta helix domain-containing protein n=1 Tax=marine sediment metagenome TaxID=412755 RepID=A0A0F9TG48_9ZZZZ